ncbi:MAG: DUF1501 domain-containing protein, partial [Planctomycetota bacterium]
MASSRRPFLIASSGSLFGLAARDLRGSNSSGARSHTPAKATILIFLDGGVSHIDTWDMKPQAPAEYRGEFQPIATSASDIQLCEHLPLTARQAHHLAIVRSGGQNDGGI